MAASNKKSAIHVLYVDDDPSILEISKQILMDMGSFDIDNAYCVDEALKKLATGHYDVVVSDYEMPLKNGLDFLKELRETPCDIAFILFTEKDGEDVAVKALNLGVDRYINKNGSPETVYCELADAINKTVEHKKSRKILQESEARYRELANCLPVIVFETDLTGKITFFSQQASEVAGFTREELEKGLNLLSFIVPEERERAMENMKKSLAAVEHGANEYTLLKKNGTTYPAIVKTNAIICENKVTGLRGIALDLTDRKKTEAALLLSEEKVKGAFETAPDAFYISTLKEGKMVEVNERFMEMFGYTRQEIIGKTSLQLGLWANLSDREEMLALLKSEGEVRNLEINCVRKNGQIFPAQFSVSFLQADKQLLVGVIRDVSSYKQAEEALKESEEKFRNLSEESPNMIFINHANRVVYANKKCEETLGYSIEEFYSADFSFLSLISPEDVETIKSAFARHMRGQAVVPYEYVLITRDGKRINAIINSTLIDYKDDKAILGIVTDITERKNTETLMKETKDHLELQIKRMPVGYIVWDKDFKAVSWNPAAEKIFGYSAKEFVGKHPYDTIVPKEAQQVVESIWQRLLEGDETAHSVNDNFTKDGKKITCAWSNTPLKREDNTVIGVLSMIQDITESKKTEETLRQERNMLESVTAASGAGLVVINKDYHVQYANDFIKRYKGDTIGKLCYATLNSLDAPCPDCGVAKIYAGKTTIDSHEYCSTTVDGNPYWVEIVATPLTDENGNVTSAVEIAVDITERKKNEETSKKEAALIDLSPDAIIVKKMDETITFWNMGAEKLYGYTKQEALGQKSNILLKAKYSQSFDGVITQLKQGKNWTDEITDYTKNNNEVIVQSHWSATLDAQGDIVEILESNVDITQRKHVEDALKESEKRSKAIVANSPIGIATSGPDKHFLTANEAFCKILCYTEDELRKLTFKDITHPEDLKESAIKIRELENGKITSFTLEKRYIKKDGTLINGKIMVSVVRNQNGKPSLFIAELEDTTERKKAEEHRKVLEAKVKNYSKHLKSMVELRTAQLKDANERLVKSERLAAIGELAGMIGHDLRNPLAGIKNAAYFLKKKGTTISEAQSKEMLEIIDKAIDHSDKIINDLLDYAREMHLELTKYGARTLVEEATRTIQVPDRIKIVNHVDEETWIWVNADKMMRVFVNLIKNAVDAMPEKGTLEISSCQTGDCVEIAFADTGTGIPEETLWKLFTPLFTTKAQGMGFGLSICKRIIEAHGGTITVKTELNNGTTFTVTLPLKLKTNVDAKNMHNRALGE